MMKKLYLIVVFFVFLGSLTFGDTDEQEEIDFLLFFPNSSNQFANQNQAMIQLDNAAEYLMGRDLNPGQIFVFGYAAAAVNDIDSVNLSRDRALFVINELEKRGVARDLFAAPVAYGSVDLWGGNTNEEDRILNRRARILLDGSFLTPAAIQAADSGIKITGTDNTATADTSRFKFPWWIIILLLIIALLAALLFLLAKKKKSAAGKTVRETPPKKVEPIAAPAAPKEKVKVLSEEEIRCYAYGLYERRNGQDGNAEGDWYLSICELTAYYEAQGYRVILYWEAENA